MRIRLAAICGAAAMVAAIQAQSVRPGDWPIYNHDLAGTRYSPLTQINTSNVAKLTEVWTFSLQSPTGRPARGPGSEATPIVVNGVMYLPAGNRVVALDPETGKQIWSHTVEGRGPSRRGVAYWPGDRQNPPRIVFTAANLLMALDARTGGIDPGFGNEGAVDMGVPYNSVPTIFKNVILVGANVGTAYDARTGAELWAFHSVPQPGEAGHDTWQGNSWEGRSGVNAWTFSFSIDEKRGLVYMPFASPAADFYGGDRPGANLFGNAIVAVDAATGKYKWHFQTIHHDLWDADPPAAPGLIDVRQNGRTIPALAEVTKSGWMYILDRVTGKPVFGVEERPVPQSDVPGEHTWPTQPIPVKPPALARVSFKPEDLVTAEDTTPEQAQACRELYERNGEPYNAGPFTPWKFRAEGAPVKASLVFPGGTALGGIEKTKAGSPVPFDKTSLDGAGPGRGNFDVRVAPGETWPCQKPPWGRLTAVNANTGDIAWQVPLGITDRLPENKQHTGRAGLAGPIVTAGGLVFIGATNDNRFRAFDANTGKQRWVTKLNRQANANPLTYEGKNGKQYVGVVASDSLIVFALP
jgi:glucose dehydrogenase